MNFSLLLSILIAAALSGGAGGWKLTQMHYEHLMDKDRQAQEVQQESARLRERAAATTYEVARAENRSKAITDTREVQREVQNDPDCSQRALPDGLRAALAAAARAPGEPVVDGAVPATPAASAVDVGRSRDGLFRALGGIPGLPSPAPGSR
jgi:DNA-binding protein YbaB